MKKLTVLLLAIVMTLSLTGCLFKPEILGTYQTETDLSDLVVERFDSGTSLTDSAFSLKYYLTEFKVVINYEFLEDGIYRISIDNGSIQTALQSLNAAAAAMIDDYLFAALKQEYTTYGFTVENREDVAALVNMSWEELCASALGSSPDEYVARIISDSFIEVLNAEYHTEGKFKARKGQLHLSESLDIDPSKEIYETYEINGDRITFTGAVNLEENKFIPYPYVLTLVES